MDWVLQSSKGRLLAHGDKKKDIQKSVEENEELTESRRRMEGELVNKSTPSPHQAKSESFAIKQYLIQYMEH